MKKSARIALTLLALLAVGQTAWWAYLIVSQQSEYRFMIIAEGMFFVAIWVIGSLILYRMLKGEIKLQKSQSDFLGAITHELKTPLANLRLALDSLERANLTEEMKKTFLERGQKSVDKLLNQIEALLTLSHGLASESTESQFTAQQLLDEALKRFDHKEKFTVEGDLNVTISAPYKESSLIVNSLLENALKYSDAPIHLHVEKEKFGVKLKIRDFGIGFSESELKNAFDPFYRSDRGRALDPTGTGIGLTLAQKLAKSNRIDISLYSDGPMKGTTATVLWKGL